MAESKKSESERPAARSPPPRKTQHNGIVKLQSELKLYGFGISARELNRLNPNRTEKGLMLSALAEFGGQQGLEQKLCSDLQRGISGDSDDLAHRVEAYGPNIFPEPPFNGFWKLWVESFKDEVLIILIIAAVVSLIVGVIEDSEKGWIDGAAILIAVLIVAFVTAGNDYQKELQFRALREDSEDMVQIDVIRNGEHMSVGIKDLVVGDVMRLSTGDKVMADALFIQGNAFKTDEAAVTGESDTIAKDPEKMPFLLSGTSVASGSCTAIVHAVGIRSMQGSIRAGTAMEAVETPLQIKLNQMVRLIGYFGTVTAILTFIAMMISWFANKENLEEDYPEFKDWLIHSFITAVTIIVVAIPEGLPLAVTISLAYSTRKMLKDNNLIRVLAACETMGNATDICSDKTGTLTENRMTVTKGWIGGQSVDFDAAGKQWTGQPQVAPNLVAVTDATLPPMLRDHLCINSTVIVTWDAETGLPILRGSKTEGAGVLLVESMGFRPIEVRGVPGGAGAGAGAGATGGADEEKATVQDIDTPPTVVRTVEDGAPAPADKESAAPRADLKTRKVVKVTQYPFTAERKMMSTLVRLNPGNPDGPVRLYVTGASEYVLARSTQLLWSSQSAGRNDAGTDRIVNATKERKDFLTEEVINTMARQSLRTLGLAYRDFASPADLPASWEKTPDDWTPEDAPLEAELTLYGVIGIMDPPRHRVKESVLDCFNAGINVRMVTGDNVNTARAIAKTVGIIQSEDDIVIEGPAFRKMTPAQVDAILPRLRVMARASPNDKNLLVRRLNGQLPKNQKEWEEEHAVSGLQWDVDAVLAQDIDAEAKGEAEHPPGVKIQDVTLPGYLSEWRASRKGPKGVYRTPIVGVTGDGTNDAPALKAADVGLSMGITGTQVAKDASDIVILDDNFNSIVSAVMWGRSVFDNIRKFLQFQLTVNVVALLLTFIAAVSQQTPPLNPVQLLWVNLIMDTMGALALGTEAPTRDLLNRRPYVLSSSLVSHPMWRNILTQSAYQMVVTLLLLYSGEDLFDIDLTYLDDNGFSINDPDVDEVNRYLNTFIFNAFVFCQVFNEFNARSIGDVVNVWKGLHTNVIFIGVIIVTVALQVFIIEVGGDFTDTSGLTFKHWAWSVILGAGAIPVGVLMRFIPIKEAEASYANYYDLSPPEEGSAVVPMSSKTVPV